MPLYACHDCGRTSDQRRCPIHRHPTTPGTGRSPNRDRAAHARFARAVKKRDHHTCQHCGATTDLRACHLTPVAQGGGYHPDNGITLCGNCDRATDPYAR